MTLFGLIDGFVISKKMTMLVLFLVAAMFVTFARGQVEGRLLDETEEELENVELKAGQMLRDIPIRNTIPFAGDKRFRCYSCEPPNCEESATGTQVCQNAVKCWKSRVRDSKSTLKIFFF